MAEVKRVLLNARRIFLLAVLLLFCAYQLASPSRWDTARENRAKQEALLSEFGGQSPEVVLEKLDLLTGNGGFLTLQDSQFYRQISHLAGFEDRLAQIQAKAENMSTISIFFGSAYAQANIQKTARDYASLEGIRLTPGMNQAVESVMANTSSDWIIGLWMLTVTYAFLEERRRGLWNVICASAKGRTDLALWRFLTLTLAAVIGGLAVTSAELAASYALHGGTDELDRMIQSVPAFADFTIPLTIGQFWGFYIGMRIFGALVAGLGFWLIFELISDIRLATAVMAGMIGLEYMLFTQAGMESLFSGVNLFSFLRPRELALQYQNLNFFGIPVGKLPLLLASGGVFMLLAVGIILLCYQRRYRVNSSVLLDKIADFLRRSTAPLGYHTSLLGHVLHRNLVTGKGALIFLAALAAALLLSDVEILGTSDPQAVYYESYLRQSQGPMARQTQDYLKSLQGELAQDQAHRRMLKEQLDSGEINAEVFETEMFRYQDLDTRTEAVCQYAQQLSELENIENAYILPHWVYESLFGQTGNQVQALTALCMVTVFLVFFFESAALRRSGMTKTQHATVRGRWQLRLIQHIGAWIITALFCGAVWAVQILQLSQTYGGLPYLDAPVRCLGFFRDVSVHYSVLEYWLLQSLQRTGLTCIWSSSILLATENLERKR